MGPDVEAFIAWLREQGFSDEHLAAFRGYLAELAKHPSLSAALRAFEDEGRSPRQIANMRQAAAKYAEFQERGAAQSAPAAKPRPAERPPAPSLEPALETESKRPASPAASANTAVARALAGGMPRRGCQCRTRYDIFLDNDFGALARLLGGGVGIGTFILIRLFGALGALAIALGFAGLGGFATILSICYRCEGCRRRVTDLDEDERAHLRKGRGMVVLVTAGLIAGSAVCGYLWWLAVKARNQA